MDNGITLDASDIAELPMPVAIAAGAGTRRDGGDEIFDMIVAISTMTPSPTA